jgi:hypothetical protein
MAVKNHTHKYERVDGVWCCAHPSCNHFMPGNVRGGDVSGKKSICWECGLEFILTIPLMKIYQPMCLICAQLKEELNVEPDMAFDRFINKLVHDKTSGKIIPDETPDDNKD